MNAMERLKCTLAICAVIMACVLSAAAQQKRLSPHETISTVIDGDRVTIICGRPYTKDPKTGQVRKI